MGLAEAGARGGSCASAGGVRGRAHLDDLRCARHTARREKASPPHGRSANGSAGPASRWASMNQSLFRRVINSRGVIIGVETFVQRHYEPHKGHNPFYDHPRGHYDHF